MNRTCKIEIVKLADTTGDAEPKFRFTGTILNNGWYTPFEAEAGIDSALDTLRKNKTNLRSFRAVLFFDNYSDKGEGESGDANAD